MKTYIGTKMISAQPMSREDYNTYRGWELPKNENGNDEGYLVEYLDGGKPNHPGHTGYISWSPKEQFEGAYKEVGDVSALQPHQQRVVAEKAELDDKLDKLSTFVASPKFAVVVTDEAERARLRAQKDTMAQYSWILAARIAAFTA